MSGTFEAFLSSMTAPAAENAGDEVPSSLPLETCLAILREHAQIMQQPCPFKSGDFVTVRTHSDVKGAGKPHIVVEVLAEPVIDMKAEAGSNQFLRKYTMRVCHYQGDSLTVHAVDHTCFEAWSEVHAQAWKLQQATAASASNRISADAQLTDVVRILRNEGRKLADAKITWKKGELVELVGYEASHAAKPMQFEGRSVGFVVNVDHSDDTTRVVYFDDDGERRTQWFKPVDLKSFAAVESV